MKKSRTQKAVDAIMRSRDRCSRFWPGRETKPVPLSIYRAAARFKVNRSAVSLALKKRLAEVRCPACKQVIRGKRRVHIPVALTMD